MWKRNETKRNGVAKRKRGETEKDGVNKRKKKKRKGIEN